MASGFLRAALTAALLAGMGAHWVALQSCAWAGMLLARARSTGFQEAVASTFDGEHPCRVCLTVEQGTRSADEQAPRASLAKVDFFHAARGVATPREESSSRGESPAALRLAAVEAFEPPPPRSFSA